MFVHERFQDGGFTSERNASVSTEFQNLSFGYEKSDELSVLLRMDGELMEVVWDGDCVWITGMATNGIIVASSS